MDATFSEDQRLFAETLRGILAADCPPEAVRASWDDPDGRVPGLWEILGGTGVLGLTVPDSHDGLGMGEVDLVLLLEELGRAACPEPVAEHVAVAVPLLRDHGSAALRDEWLGRAASGKVVLTAASPVDDLVLAAGRADLSLLGADGALHAVPADRMACTGQESVDSSRRLARVDWTPSADTLLSDDPAVVDGWLDRGAWAAAAQAVGVAQRLLDMTVAYVADREQFGHAVGANQAVKHHCANVAIDLEFARPMVQVAAWSLACGESPTDGGSVSIDVSMAKSLASDALDRACRIALQCHGAIGYTIEYDLQLWLKRGWALAASWGDSRLHRRRIAAGLGLSAGRSA